MKIYLLYQNSFSVYLTTLSAICALSLHDALPISSPCSAILFCMVPSQSRPWASQRAGSRSEEHTSELQSRRELVCRLLLEKKKLNKDFAKIGILIEFNDVVLLTFP